MKTAAIDNGERRVGIAISDDLGMLARPLATIQDASPKRRLAQTAAALRNAAPDLVLVGLPKNMDGSEGPAAAAARAFAGQIAAATNLPVRLVDERLSTVQASRSLREQGLDSRKQRTRIDAASAAVLLQAHLDAQG